MNDAKCVYVIFNQVTNLVKVGISNNPHQRLQALQCASGCQLMLLYKSKNIDFARAIEFLVHCELKEGRVYGEWFNTNKDVVVDRVMSLCRDHGDASPFWEAQSVDKPKKKQSHDRNMFRPGDRVAMYQSGMPIAVIAKELGVTRQAVIKSLKKAGVHDKWRINNVPIEQKKNKPQTDCPIDIDSIPIMDEAIRSLNGDTEKRIGKNLYINKDGYVVKFFVGEKTYTQEYNSRDSILNAFSAW